MVPWLIHCVGHCRLLCHQFNFAILLFICSVLLCWFLFPILTQKTMDVACKWIGTGVYSFLACIQYILHLLCSLICWRTSLTVVALPNVMYYCLRTSPKQWSPGTPLIWVQSLVGGYIVTRMSTIMVVPCHWTTYWHIKEPWRGR